MQSNDRYTTLSVREGAETFARQINFPVVEVLISESAYESHIKKKLLSENDGNGPDLDIKDKVAPECPEQVHDTVGAVAIDRKGHTAVSSSTGTNIRSLFRGIICFQCVKTRF